MTSENGAYRWTCEADEEYKRDSYHFTIKVCGGACLFLLLITAIVSPDSQTLLFMLLTCGLVMLLGVGVSRHALYGRERLLIPYEMTERYIHAGTGKGSAYVGFRTVKKMETDGNKIRLYTKFTKTTIFVPQESFEQIKAYMLDRIEKE